MLESLFNKDIDLFSLFNFQKFFDFIIIAIINYLFFMAKKFIMLINKFIKLFVTNVSIFYLWKHKKTPEFSGILWGYKMKTLAIIGLS